MSQELRASVVPVALVDKSALQGLNSKQLSAFHDRHRILITPILLNEVLGNLVKSKLSFDEAKARVVNFASRIESPKSLSVPNFRHMSIANLLGYKIPMDGYACPFDLVEVTAGDGSKEFHVKETFDRGLLKRWAAGNFTDEDWNVAGNLTRECDATDLPGLRAEMWRPKGKRAKSFDEIKLKIRKGLDRNDNWELIEIHAKYCFASDEVIQRIRFRWERLGKPRFDLFAPYAYYCSELAFIFFIGVTDGLISANKKAKTVIDLRYLYYLPFSEVFISNDKFHRRMFPIAARPDQNFVWGEDLIAELN